MSALDDFPIALGIIYIGAILLVCYFIFTGLGGITDVNQEITGYGQKTMKAMDLFAPALLVLGTLASAWMASRVESHPLFVIVGIIILVILAYTIPMMSNIYIKLANNAQLSSTSTQFPMTNAVVQNLPLLIFISASIISIALYGKNVLFGGTIGGGGLG